MDRKYFIQEIINLLPRATDTTLDLLMQYLLRDRNIRSAELPLEYDEKDADLILQGGWRFDKNIQKVVKSRHGEMQQLHRMIAQRKEGDIKGKFIKFKDDNPFNVRRSNLYIGDISRPQVYQQQGNLLYMTLRSGATIRISKDDERLYITNKWHSIYRDGKLAEISTEKHPRRLCVRVAERVLGRSLYDWEQVSLRDKDPTHCERENIEIGYKKSFPNQQTLERVEETDEKLKLLELLKYQEKLEQEKIEILERESEERKRLWRQQAEKYSDDLIPLSRAANQLGLTRQALYRHYVLGHITAELVEKRIFVRMRTIWKELEGHTNKLKIPADKESR